MGKKNKSLINIDALDLLAVLFITLKLMGKITWSWVWVLSPWWIPTVATLTILAIVFIVAFILGKWG